MTNSKDDLPIDFYFQVNIENKVFAFKEVSGISAEIETDSIEQGGMNEFKNRLHNHVNHGNLCLKLSLHPISIHEVTWLKNTLEGDFSQPIVPKDIIVNLIGQDETPIYTWTFANAYPVKWEVISFDAQTETILLETIEFAYTTMTRS